VAPLKMQISYLSERDIDRDGQAVLIEDIRRQLDYPTAEVTFNRLAPISETVTFEFNEAQIPPDQTKLLDLIGRAMQQNPTLQIELQAGQTPSEIGTLAQDRSLAIQNYLQTQWQIQPVGSSTQNERRYLVKTELATTSTVRLNTTIESLQNAAKIDPIDGGETNIT
jgi:outer membrane protein OmpA-like peptidoglycan-associated protein